jgi:hypothetical protein
MGEFQNSLGSEAAFLLVASSQECFGEVNSKTFLIGEIATT